MNEDQPKVDDVINLDTIPTTKDIRDIHQEGNYLVGVTELGVKFRHRIPADKILMKQGDAFVLTDRVVT
jgi:hypothetical protein